MVEKSNFKEKKSYSKSVAERENRKVLNNNKKQIIKITIALIAGACVGAFIPGPGPDRSWVWMLAGMIVTVSAYFGIILTSITQKSLGRWTGSAVVIITTSALSMITAFSPVGCGSCTRAEVQGWTNAGIILGLSLVTWSLLKSLTNSVISVSKKKIGRNSDLKFKEKISKTGRKKLK
jgi:hypothetical protein